jgi:hypothetical protein
MAPLFSDIYPREDVRFPCRRAAPEDTGIPVLHHDEDYDRIAAITGQEVLWIAPRGALS